MVDEIKIDDVVVNDDLDVSVVDASAVRKSPLFLSQAKLAQELKSKLEAYEAKEKMAEQLQQQKLLEEQGNWKALLQQKESEIENLQKTFNAEKIKDKLTNKLLASGVTHPAAIKLALMDYPVESGVEGIEEFVKSLSKAEDYKIFFNSEPVGKVGPSPVSPSKSSSVSWAQIKADLTGPDPVKAKMADRAIFDYMTKNGKMPDVFNK